MREEQTIFLVESPHSWGGVWQRPHHIFRILGEDYPTYYVATRYFRDAWAKRSEYLRGRFLTPASKLTVREIILLNGERLPLIRWYNIRHLARTLNKFASFHQGAKKILWLYDPHQVRIVDLVPHNLLVYDIMDEYTGFPWSPPGVADEEKELLARADVVIAGTYALYETKKPLVKRGQIECILSAVDFAHFHSAAKPTSLDELPDDLAEIKKQFTYIAGYYGVVDMRIDTSLIHKVALALPDWAFVFVGPLVGDKIKKLKNQKVKNIFFSGRRHYNELPQYARGFDVCMIPFVLDRLTLHINPTKVLEYFAAGKPVVSVPIPDILRFYKDIVFIATTEQEFINALKTAVNPDVAQKRVRLGLEKAKESSWGNAVKKIENVINLS